MNEGDAFFDSNVLLYIASSDKAKADEAERLAVVGGVISVQVLNECANVSRRKLRLQWSEVREVLGVIRGLCRVEPVTFSVHEHGVALAERFGFQVYDAMILASAIKAGCQTLYSEDLQNGQTIEGLTIRNPFAGL